MWPIFTRIGAIPLIEDFEVGVTPQPTNGVKAQLYDTGDPLVLAVETIGDY
jgi:hypothetical protein